MRAWYEVELTVTWPILLMRNLSVPPVSNEIWLVVSNLIFVSKSPACWIASGIITLLIKWAWPLLSNRNACVLDDETLKTRLPESLVWSI